MQLRPQEYFTIARGLEDHTDETTHYVRAFIRNARTDELIATIDLTDQGDGHRFSKPWQVPADPSGEGFYILITTSVYTDSGYTTKSTLYGDKFDTLLIQDRANPNLHGGGGADIDYKKLRKIVEEVVGQKITAMELPTVDLKPLYMLIGELQKSISSIDIPKPEKTNLEPILTALDAIESLIRGIEMPKLDLSAVLGGIEETKQSLSDLKDTEFAATTENAKTILEKIQKFFDKDIADIKAEVVSIKESFDKVPFVPVDTTNLRSKQNQEPASARKRRLLT